MSKRYSGVTSALTEALENTVRGNPFELEETLNKCMEIYPELFTVTIKRPSKNSNFRKTYNTSGNNFVFHFQTKVNIYNELVQWYCLSSVEFITLHCSFRRHDGYWRD